MQENSPNDVAFWIIGRKFLSLTRRESDWLIRLEPDTQIRVECLWRLIETGRARRTSEDHGQQFGLPDPIDAAADVNRCIVGQRVDNAVLLEGTLDLELRLERGWIMQLIPSSSGYEAWSVICPIGEFIAVGGGELVMCRNSPAGR